MQGTEYPYCQPKYPDDRSFEVMKVGEAHAGVDRCAGRAACWPLRSHATDAGTRGRRLKRSKGAPIVEIVKAFDWQAHTVREAMAGALKGKLGLKIDSEQIERRGRVYRIKA